MAKELVIKWSGKDYPVELAETDTVEQLKRMLQEKTQVTALQGMLGRDKDTQQGSACAILGAINTSAHYR